MSRRGGGREGKARKGKARKGRARKGRARPANGAGGLPAQVETGVGHARVEAVGGSGRRLVIDEEIHGQVDLADPTNLVLDYQSRLCRILVALDIAPGGRVLHIGGGAFAIPRALAAQRPDLTHTVVERSAAIIRLAEAHLGLQRTRQLVVRKGDGRAAVERLPDDSIDVIVCDAFVGQDLPRPFTTTEFSEHVARVLGRRGVYVVNIVDEQPWSRLGSIAAAVTVSFDHVAAMGSRGVARLVDPGNVFLLASDTALPLRGLTHAGAVHVHPFAAVTTGRLGSLVATNRAPCDND